VVGRATLATAEKAKRPVAVALSYLTLLMDDILKKFPAGVLPPIEEVTLFKQLSIKFCARSAGFYCKYFLNMIMPAKADRVIMG